VDTDGVVGHLQDADGAVWYAVKLTALLLIVAIWLKGLLGLGTK
jgi:hypothetical protein